MPDGSVMSESAAITLLLADITGEDSLVPRPDTPERAAFLRWLVFLVANVYPTFTYADIPGRFVEIEAAQQPFVATVEAYRDRLWHQVEGEAKAPWFLGERFSALAICFAFRQRLPGTLDDAAMNLAVQDQRIDRLAAIINRTITL